MINEIDKKIITELWKQKSYILRSRLENEAEKINDMDLITTIHYDMPNPYNEPQLED